MKKKVVVRKTTVNLLGYSSDSEIKNEDMENTDEARALTGYVKSDFMEGGRLKHMQRRDRQLRGGRCS